MFTGSVRSTEKQANTASEMAGKTKALADRAGLQLSESVECLPGMRKALGLIPQHWCKLGTVACASYSGTGNASGTVEVGGLEVRY